MKVYFIHPVLTIGDSREAVDFFTRCENELRKYTVVVTVDNELVLRNVEVGKDDSLVFFNINHNGDAYSPAVTRLFQQVSNSKTTEEIKSTVVPIAIGKESRNPQGIFSDVQSFDVIDELRRRGLGPDYLPTVAVALARTIVSRQQPTIYKDKMKFFISHRRSDGEKISAKFCDDLRLMGEKSFRDLFDVQVGENAQEIIESELIQCDAVIFLDTPQTGQSSYIKKELELALSHNVPIIWVKVGGDNGRIPLGIEPHSEPHFSFPEINEDNPDFHPLVLEEIVNKTFEISREAASKVYDQIQRIKDLESYGVNVQELDRRNLVYRMSIKRTGMIKYTQKPIMHIVQMFGRTPKQEDITSIGAKINQLSYVHPEWGPFHDTTLLLTPRSVPKSNTISEAFVMESSDDYVAEIERLSIAHLPKSLEKKKIVLSGAFPDSDVQFHQKLTDAVYVFTHEILRRRGNLVFGAHPTFQHLIFGKARELVGEESNKYVTMYISEYFLAGYSLTDIGKLCTIIPTKVEENLEKSLTELRIQMIANNDVSALIVLGGKEKGNGQKPGIDEEIEIAIANGIPVYIIGSVGGRSAQLASKIFNEKKFSGLNNLSIDDNLLLMYGADYRVIADKILSSLN
ncbi:TIR domain-containing protein [Brevibacillus sp. SAFN-007a]|uniref:SLOG domain-containing protein n=1 Tax=Brevibacillus sp. SAFN-007a TaxID=3436862 RepID=UPI003F8014CB